MEYSRLGNVIKGQEKAVTKSRYEENVFLNNHTVRRHLCNMKYVTLSLPIECMGFILGRWQMGICLLSLLYQRVILCWRSWQISQKGRVIIQ